MVGKLIISQMCCHSLLWLTTPLSSKTICVWWIIFLRNLLMEQLLVHFRAIHFLVPVLCCRYKQCQNGTVHDLSFPESASVNSGIPKDSYLNHEYKLTLPGRLTHFIRLHGRHCHIYKKDLARAFCQMPLDPKDVPLLGFVVNIQLLYIFTHAFLLDFARPLWYASK